MQCFVHPNLGASAVCKKCGKAMCVDCSAFANHSGFCPNCRKDSIAEGLRKINGIKNANVWVVIILNIFVLAGTGVVYFFDIFKNPLIFIACATVPFSVLYLVLRLKKLRGAEQGLNANLAQINLTLSRAVPHAGILNPLNIYQDLDACKTVPGTESWTQLAFIEPVPEEMPVYSAGRSGKAIWEEERPQTPAVTPVAAFIYAPDIEELKIAAGKLISEDDIFEGQITFREVIEDLIKAFNRPVEDYFEDPVPPRPRQQRPRPTTKSAGAAISRPRVDETSAPTSMRPENTSGLRAATPAPTAVSGSHKAAPTKKPPQKPQAKSAPPPRPLYTEDEKRANRERAEMRKQLDKLRSQINDLYNKNR